MAWTRTLASVFPAPGLSTDNGWSFVRYPALGLYVGSVRGPAVSHTDSTATFDLSSTMTAGFRISDGTAVWRDPGTFFECGGPMPCPAAGTGLRLRTTGRASINISQAASIPNLASGADVVLEGFDLATGKTLWSYNAGSDGSLLSESPPLFGTNAVALPAPGGGMVVVNLTTGARSPVPPVRAGAVGWCQVATVYTTQIGYVTGNGTFYQRPGQPAIRPCRASGASAAPPQRVPGYVGTDVDGLTVWGEPSEVAAAPTS